MRLENQEYRQAVNCLKRYNYNCIKIMSIREGFKIHLMNMDVNYKFLDTQKIIDYMNGHLSFIEVEDIIQNSGADKLRVYPALFELEQSGFLEVVEREELGAPLIVRKRKNR